MRKNPLDESGRWFLQANHDLDDARYMLEGKRFNVACFLAQQAAEKFLKAFLYASQAEDLWGHSVADLCQKASTFDKEFSKHCRRWAVLDKYYIPTRYPNGLPGGIPSEAFDKNDAQRAISITEDVALVIKKKLGK